MSGVYIHIPFCASRCIYCDFYSTTIRGKAHEYVDALLKEYEERSDFLPSEEPLRTIYIGGGTPSLLPISELKRLIDFFNNYDIEEFTIEANPEDICEEWAKSVGQYSNIRISIGVQSLNDNELRIINRRHNSKKPIEAVKLLRDAGINNISLDLMYGLPTQTLETWEESINGIIALNPEHISAYCLSVEEESPLGKLVEDGKLTPADEELCLEMAELLRKKLKEAGVKTVSMLAEGMPHGYFESAFKEKLEAYVKNHSLRTMTIQGELCAPGIQQNRLKLLKPEWYVFTIREDGKRIGLQKMLDICEELGMEHVPIEEVGVDLPSKYPTVDSLLARADGEYPKGGKKEGIVIRPTEPVFCSLISASLSMKVVSNKYLLKNGE